jgi:hypothetical protein
MFGDLLVSPKMTEHRGANAGIRTRTSRFIVAPKLAIAPCHLGQNRSELGNGKSEGCTIRKYRRRKDICSRMCERAEGKLSFMCLLFHYPSKELSYGVLVGLFTPLSGPFKV